MIPKKIHYCWFGRSELPKLAKKCIASWKKYCPDYEIVQWNEDSFDLGCNPYVRRAYEEKKYAFLSDYVRLAVVEECGGIYLDTDVELRRSLDPLLDCSAFFGFENSQWVASGLGFGAEPHAPVMRQLLLSYEPLMASAAYTGCPILNTRALVSCGLVPNGQRQSLAGGVEIYPPEYFNPYDDPTGRLFITENTYSIHWYSKSWLPWYVVWRSHLTKPLHRLFGTDFARKKSQ